MGINPLWQEDAFLTLQNICHDSQMLQVNPYFIIDFKSALLVHLIPLNNNFNPQELIDLQNYYQLQNKLLVHIWEDVWLNRRVQVLSRINSFLGFNKTIHGRKTQLQELDLHTTKQFFNENHLQGYAKSKYNYGLIINNELIAVAGFSDNRLMKSKGDDYQSAELIRFASKNGITIVGGLSKLIKYFLAQHKPNDLMTYADRDWSLGKGYQKLSFQLSEVISPLFFYVEKTTGLRYFSHRLPKNIQLTFKAQNELNLEDFLLRNNYVKVFNTGNLKYHLYY